MGQNRTAVPLRIAQTPVPTLSKPDVGLSAWITKLRQTIDRSYGQLARSISEHHGSGDLAERPAPGVRNRTYLVMDAAPKLLSIDDGAAWHDIILPILLVLLFGAAPLYAQTATPTDTPTNTPTVTPTATVTPTSTPTSTNTPIGTKPFRADNLETKIATWIGLVPAPAVAPANDGRIYYDATGQDFMCSKNGGGYVVCGLVQPTATPIPTDTPLVDLLYSGKLNLGANASGTPLGLVTITADATPAPHDRVIICINGSPTPTPIVYTMPAATGSGRVIDMIVGGQQVGGGGSCMMDAGSDFMNDGHSNLLSAGWNADTCYDMAPGQWACRNMKTPTATPTATSTPTATPT